jgi:hypothetical protein
MMKLCREAKEFQKGNQPVSILGLHRVGNNNENGLLKNAISHIFIPTHERNLRENG